MVRSSGAGIGEIPIAEARTKLPKLSKELSEQNQAVAITVRGKPTLALMPWELFEAITETLEIMGDTDMMAALKQGIKEAREGKNIPWEEAKARLDLV